MRGLHRHEQHDVLGLGAPIIDLILRVDDSFLQTVPGELHGMEPITHEGMEGLIKTSGQVPVPVPGGSTSNMLRGLASFGHSCAVVGKVGQDERGERYLKGLQETGVDGWLLESSTPSTTVLSLVESCGARTMRTYMGASEELAPDELEPEFFAGVRLLHVEGYAFYNFPTMKRALEMAKVAGAKVSMDLASFEVVRQFRAQVEEVLPEYVDIVFANHDEAKEITGEEPDRAVDALSKLCETAIVMMSRDGCMVRRGDEKVAHPAFVVEQPVDTTGAGDLFASGFLHGYLEGEELRDCARAGSLSGAACVQVLGAVIPKSLWPALLTEI